MSAGWGRGAGGATNQRRQESTAIPPIMKRSTPPTKATTPAKVADQRELEVPPEHRPMMLALYRRAEAQLRKQKQSKTGNRKKP